MFWAFGINTIDTIKIENTGQLPVGVKFTTSFPFSIVVHQNQSPVEEWVYEFAAEEIIRLTINFDGRHLRKDRGSVFFDSVLVATNVDLPGIVLNQLNGCTLSEKMFMDMFSIPGKN